MTKDYYEEIVDYIVENQDRFYRIVFTYTRNEEDAMDIVQDAICKALQNYSTLRNINAMKTWFYKILINESRTFLKKHRKELLVYNIEAYMKEHDDFSKDADLYEVINYLKEDVQHIVKLKFYEEMTLNEIAEIMNMNVNTVKAKLYRGINKLKQIAGGHL